MIRKGGGVWLVLCLCFLGFGVLEMEMEMEKGVLVGSGGVDFVVRLRVR